MNVSLFVPYAFLYHSSDCDETSVSCCAVSYTHLDVYKRQLYHSSDCDETSVSCCAHARKGL